MKREFLMNLNTRVLKLNKKLISVCDIATEEIQEVFNIARAKDFKISPGKTFISLFFENSTRTLLSFEKAANICGFNVLRFDPGASSLVKDETEINTIRTLCAMGVDACAIRTGKSGYTALLANYFSAETSILNAGDGSNQHPTQALLDLYTILENFNIVFTKNCLKSLKIGIMGDILNSRVARSNIMLLSKLGANITLIAPPNFLPWNFRNYYMKQFNCVISYDLAATLKAGLDILMCLRVQKERMESGGKFSFSSALYSVKSEEELNGAKIMHPGPINERVEISGSLAYESNNSLISKQVENGVYIRSALLKFLCG